MTNETHDAHGTRPQPVWRQEPLSPEQEPRLRLLGEMNDLWQHVIDTLGPDAALSKLIAQARESGDVEQLQLASAAIKGQPADVQKRLNHGWAPPGSPPSRESLLQKASGKPVRYFLQLDGDISQLRDDVWGHDEEGHGTMAGGVFELRNTDFPVRVQIAEGTSKPDALALLGKLMRWLEKDWEELVDQERKPLAISSNPDPFADPFTD